MLTRVLSSRRGLVLLAVVTLVVPAVVLGLYGMFQDRSEDGAPTSWAMVAWLVGPYVALAGLLLWAAGSAQVGFRVAVAVTAAVIVVQSVLLAVLTLDSDEALAAVGVLIAPVFYLGCAVVLVVVGLVLHLRTPGSAGAPGGPLAEGSPGTP